MLTVSKNENMKTSIVQFVLQPKSNPMSLILIQATSAILICGYN